ncbi:cell wall hydrolase [Sphingomonadaceae bacterium]|nr:cell wall hydrolase [Sphingomonadaceae bacterium]
MSRKVYKFSAAAIAASLIITVASAEGFGLNAQETDQTGEAAAESLQLTDETVPVFITEEVVQPLPEKTPEQIEQEILEEQAAAAAEAAGSLRELIAATAIDGQLSRQMECLAGAIYFESRGEPINGQLAVGQVVVNRAESSVFPDTYCDVVYQRAQFSFVRGGRMPSISRASAAWKRAKALAHIAHQGLWESGAEDSLYFHANYVSPSWARRKTQRTRIDTHIFYR